MAMLVTPAGWRVVPVSGKPGEEENFEVLFEELLDIFNDQVEDNADISGFPGYESLKSCADSLVTTSKRFQNVLIKLGISSDTQLDATSHLRIIGLFFLLFRGIHQTSNAETVRIITSRAMAALQTDPATLAGTLFGIGALKPTLDKVWKSVEEIKKKNVAQSFIRTAFGIILTAIITAILNAENERGTSISLRRDVHNSKETAHTLKKAWPVFQYFNPFKTQEQTEELNREWQANIVEKRRTENAADWERMYLTYIQTLEFLTYVLILYAWELLSNKCRTLPLSRRAGRRRGVRNVPSPAPDPEPEPEPEPGPTYLQEGQGNVEKFVSREVRNGVTGYIVKWVGYPDEENTWEKEDDLMADLGDEFQEYTRGL
jgi:hypothetical protein